MFYNSVVVFIPVVALAIFTEDLNKVKTSLIVNYCRFDETWCRYTIMIVITMLVLYVLFFFHHLWAFYSITLLCYVQIIIHRWQQLLLVLAKYFFVFFYLLSNYLYILQNMFVTYLGIFVGGDYIYSFVNFIGLNVRWIEIKLSVFRRGMNHAVADTMSLR